MEARPAADSASLLIRWMSITDANSAGFIHGGVVMRMCDEAAGIAAIRHCGSRVVTAGMDRMTFAEPIWVGELLRCCATVNAAWTTSREEGGRVEAENAVSAAAAGPPTRARRQLNHVLALKVVQRDPADQHGQPEGDGPEEQHGGDRLGGLHASAG